ncbi:MAG: hypothetical protein NC400_04770 [Clostridium sp.]|nr:hypothetical protein [Clostridium sp.]
MAIEKINLEKWKFALGNDITCLENGRHVRIPHTWNIEEGSEEYWGIGWYAYNFVPEELWKEKRVRVLFRAVYHDAYIYLNGKEIGVHKNSGYTPFVAELTKALRMGEENQLAVKVDNRFSEQMLPYDTSFDWANDGGLIRPVELLVTGRSFIKDPEVMARPVITLRRERQDAGSAVFGLTACAEGGEAEELSLEWTLYEGCDDKLGGIVCEGKERVQNGMIEIPGRALSSVKYWHFDSPCLYTLKMVLKAGEETLDKDLIVFGFREFKVWGREFYLNGEPVRLPGTEWMPGSDPAYGMAEPKEQLEKMLLCLKESNSILTRFHWQQDDWVYDWCDRHGMLVQEEVPFWGTRPPKAGGQQWKIFKEQIGEMIAFHRNHPSIIFWGVGNELDGQCKETIQYIKDAVAYTHRLDPSRLANYVSNSIYKGHSLDGTTDGDVMMINDYIGTWHEGYDQYKEWDAIVKENPDRPMVPSEFGLCEPAFSGGDKRREAIFKEKLACYRKYPNIAGTVYFCLNDYRTQMGEDGEGKLKKRVHGSTGLCGEPKPSYYTVQKEYSPLLLEAENGALTVKCRDDLPSYTVKGYTLKLKEREIKIPDMKPGDVWTVESIGLVGNADLTENIGLAEDDKAKVYRPGGERVL